METNSRSLPTMINYHKSLMEAVLYETNGALQTLYTRKTTKLM